MKELDRTRIKVIKSKVAQMLEERKALEAADAPTASPSQYWSDFCSFFDYMMGLPEESFAKLRLHTYHLTGDTYQTYYLGDPESFLKASGLDQLTSDLPPVCILNEPEGGIGFRYDNGRFVSSDILRFQRVVTTLYRHGILSALWAHDAQRSYVLEIGGGYGGLAHHFCNICRNVTYVTVDLPETLLFSAAYLSLLNPQKKIYVYDKDDFAEFIQSSAVSSYDFVMLPNYKLDSIRHLRFDLVINVSSLQEMRTNQVEAYLDFIRETSRGVFYSWNQDRSARNRELSSLSDLLRERFELFEVLDSDASKTKVKTKTMVKLKVRKLLKRIALHVRLLDRPKKTTAALPYREYICKPLGIPDGSSQVGHVDSIELARFLF